jgi:hypothetical protein
MAGNIPVNTLYEPPYGTEEYFKYLVHSHFENGSVHWGEEHRYRGLEVSTVLSDPIAVAMAHYIATIQHEEVSMRQTGTITAEQVQMIADCADRLREQYAPNPMQSLMIF